MADTDVFVMARKNAFIEAAKSDPAVEVNFSDANNDASKQLDQIDNFIAQKVNAIVVVPVDYQGIVPGVEKANAAGIPVIALGIQSAGGKYTFVGSKNIDAGRLQGEFMKTNLPKDAKILYLEGTPGLSHTQERKKGFEDALGRSDVDTLASLSANYDRAEGMKVTEDWIQSFPKFDAIVAANDQMALGALEALKGADRLKGVLISGVDGVPDALTAIKAGEMSQTIFQDAAGQAKAAFEVVEGIKKGEQPPAEKLVPFASITKENVDQFIKK
ncbi:sugar ABC transporter substrate-binding protein [Neorhizobium sp. DT-125]|uniref:sugar ABC transporter substrate-binding protein n=1 Tax=Neorhizobium sp. DT-125 TaxID=3396163 RepID=UPI003F1B845C